MLRDWCGCSYPAPASPGMVNSKEQGFCAWFALNPRAWQVAGSLWDNWAGSKWPEILGTDTSDDWHLSEERGKEATLLPQSWEGNKGEGPEPRAREGGSFLQNASQTSGQRAQASGSSGQQGGGREPIVPVLLGEGPRTESICLWRLQC